jgi:signal transduction histidine kinase
MLFLKSVFHNALIFFRQNASGMGKVHYPIRVIGYLMVLAVLLTGRYYFEYEYKIFSSLIVLCLLWPHISYLVYLYYNSKSKAKTEKLILLGDAFGVGIIINAIGFSLFPSFALMAMVCSGNMAIKGLKQFWKGMIAVGLGITVSGLFIGYHFNSNNNLYLNLLIGAGLFFYCCYFAYTGFNSIRLLKRARNSIKKKAEQVEYQKQFLEANNLKLQEAQEVIKRQNKELHQYSISLEKQVNDRTRLLEEAYNQLMKTSKELDSFIYKASHDVMGPLATVQGLIQLALQESKDEVSLKYFNQMQGVTFKMRNTLSSLIKVMTIKEYQPQWQEIHSQTFMEKVMDRIKLKHGIIGVRVRLNIDYDQFFSDQELLEITVYNIVENAIQYKKPNRVEESFVEVDVVPAKGAVEIIVKDNGIGIMEESKDQIFDMFYRGTELSRGSGLGLYMAKTAMEKIGGSITYRRNELSQTVFAIRIPVDENEKATITMSA